ncbi:MAG TPA: hypothetical protein PKA06_04380, partial [Gemmatales bacterium]|nr:hypothetical protein [Gemmatales bacterium]
LSSSDLRGQPAVLLFLQPGSNLTKRLAEELPLKLKKLDSSRYKVCLLLSKTGSLPSIPPGCLTAYGQPLLGTFHVQVTPYVVLLDSDGTLLLSKEGWGPEIEQELFKLMKQELAKLR